MPYQRFDIVMLRPDFGAKVYAILDLLTTRPESPYLAVRLDRGPLTRRYRLSEDHILARIGTLDPGALDLNPNAVEMKSSTGWKLGQHYARYMAQQAPAESDRRRWAVLAELKPGDSVSIRHFTGRGPRVEQHRFREVVPSGKKYHFAAVNANGTVYRWPLSALYLEGDAG